MSISDNQTGRLTPQSMLQQRYIIVSQAGRGGMGAVYGATDTRLAHRRVAIKEMSQAHMSDSELADANNRFQQEAAMLGSLSHPNLPRIYDAFSENNRSYLVMDYIEGMTLHEMLKESNGRPISIEQALLYARQLCDVLAYLHQHNPPIIFRDVKPTNVMVTENGRVFLIDFGIARFFKEGQQQDTVFLGSPGYAPPEQHGMGQTNPRSDIYGLGATLHYALSSKDPYYSTDRFTFKPVRAFNPLVPVELDQLILRMVAQNERDRPASVLEVQQALLAIHQRAAEYTNSLAPLAATPEQRPTQYVAKPQAPQAPSPAMQQVGATPYPPTVAMQRATQATPSSMPFRRSGSVWTPGFLALSGGLLLLTVGASVFALNFVCPSANTIETVLTTLLLLAVLGAIFAVKGLIPRSIMFVTAICVFIAGSSSYTLSQPEFAVMEIISPSSVCNPTNLIIPQGAGLSLVLFIAGIGITGLISLYWLTSPEMSQDRRFLLIAFGTALISYGVSLVCILAQSFVGDADTRHLLEALRHIMLVLTLIAMIQGVVFAARVARLYA